MSVVTPRFFSPTPIVKIEQMVLDDSIYQHWCKVLRAKVGDIGVVFDGTGGEWQVKLTHIDKKNGYVDVLNHNPINRTLPYKITLGLVMSRGERMDYAIQKATEMGVHAIQLLTSERSQETFKYDRDRKKIDHWQKIVISSCEQCGLNIIPKILSPISLADWVTENFDELKLVLNLDGKTAPPIPLPKTIALLIGAEGGLSDTELRFAKDNGFLPWVIGERVLRTETAPVVAMACLHSYYQISGGNLLPLTGN